MTDKELKKLKNLIPNRTKIKYTEWSDTEKQLDEIISCINMINSCIAYDELYKFNEKYYDEYSKKLGSRVVDNLIKSQVNDVFIIHRGVYTDFEGLSYNSIEWKE